MEEIAISKFKATCFAVLERVRQTKQPIRVARFGNPLPKRRNHLASAPIEIHADIVEPIGDVSDWEAAREGPLNDHSKGTKENKGEE